MNPFVPSPYRRYTAVGLQAAGLCLLTLIGPAIHAATTVSLEAGVVIREAPPAPRREVIVTRPSTRHVWINGYWRWNGENHVWVPGHWELPPRSGAGYVAPRWEFRDGGYVFVDGYWAEPQVQVSSSQMPVTETIIVSEPPPTPRDEAVTERPTPQHVWISGYWVWRDNRYIWIAGHWEQAPQPGMVYATPHWEDRGTGYVFIDGGWRNAAATQPVTVLSSAPIVQPSNEIIVDQAPPAPREEVIVTRPSPRHVWIAGHWRWHEGRYVWIPGHWDLPPRSDARYVAPHWEARGHSYVFIEGYWR